MPRNYVPVRFNATNDTGYTTDIGNTANFNVGFFLPPGMPEPVKEAILAAIGATPLANLEALKNAPCPDTDTATPRKLRFIRAGGAVTEIPVSDKANLTTAATTIRNLFNTNNLQVLCIQLLGEKFPNLNDQLGLNYQNTFAKSHIIANGGKHAYYSGSANYNTDVVPAGADGSVVFQSIKSITDNLNSPSTQLASVWASCVGNLTVTRPCKGMGKTNPRDHRRFHLDFITKVDPDSDEEESKPENIQLPVVSATAAEILKCGQDAAKLPGAYCIGYEGESYSRFHQILA